MKQDFEDEKGAGASAVFVGRLRRDLGTLESYAALLGILIGAGIFKVTSDAGALTGPSVILGYALLTPVVLATSVAYSAFLSTDRKSTRLNSSHRCISYAVFCLKKKTEGEQRVDEANHEEA